jgi:uncharacterized protein (DUF2062 family)
MAQRVRSWIKGQLPSRKKLLSNRWLAPLSGRLSDPIFWRLRRRPIRSGLAAGLFSAFILPVGQIPLAILIALPLRGNVLIAATATFVSNPVTFPFIYILAYYIGGVLLALSSSYRAPSEALAATVSLLRW